MPMARRTPIIPTIRASMIFQTRARRGIGKDLPRIDDGEPFVQGPDDPFPGYYVSATALADRTKRSERSHALR